MLAERDYDEGISLSMTLLPFSIPQVAWNYLGGQNQVKEFTTEERDRWNKEKKKTTKPADSN